MYPGDLLLRPPEWQVEEPHKPSQPGPTWRTLALTFPLSSEAPASTGQGWDPCTDSLPLVPCTPRVQTPQLAFLGSGPGT